MDLTEALAQLEDAAAAVRDALGGCNFAGLGVGGAVGVVAACQRVSNVVGGVQTVAVAQVAAFDEVQGSDRVWRERHLGLGHVALDAAGVLAPELGVSAQVASLRVESAVAQVVAAPSVVRAMLAGEVDPWRARVAVAEAVSMVGAEGGRVSDPVISQGLAEVFDDVAEHYQRVGGWCESAGPLRARVRKMVGRALPELVRGEAQVAREKRGVRRWPVSPGADRWEADLPAEVSVPMWQAVESQAKVLQRADPTLSVDQARADALAELVLSEVTTMVHLHATVPASAYGDVGVFNEVGAVEAGGLVELGGLGVPSGTVIDLGRLAAVPGVSVGRSSDLACAESTGAVVAGSVPASLAGSTRKDPARSGAEALVRTSNGAARVGRDAVRVRRDAARFSSAYVVPADMVRLVRLRDGRCRFPNCAVPASRTDQDHVIAWPVGATTPHNLICLCRRHHRVKQRRRWTVRLDPDGVAYWRDPTGAQRVTYPVDQLALMHLPNAGPPNAVPPDLALGDAAREHEPVRDDRHPPRRGVTRVRDLDVSMLEVFLEREFELATRAHTRHSARLRHLGFDDVRCADARGIDWVTPTVRTQSTTQRRASMTEPDDPPPF